MSDDYVPQRAKHALWRGHTAPSATERLQLLDPDYRTVFYCTWRRQTYRTLNSSSRQTHFFGQCDFTVWTVLIAPFRNKHSYLLTRVVQKIKYAIKTKAPPKFFTLRTRTTVVKFQNDTATIKLCSITPHNLSIRSVCKMFVKKKTMPNEWCWVKNCL